MPQVRAQAGQTLEGIRDLAALTRALAVVLTARIRLPGPAALTAVCAAICAAAGPEEVFAELADSSDPLLRRWAFAHARDNGLLETADLIGLLERDGDPRLVTMAGRWLRQDEPTAQLVALLRSRRSGARLLAVERLPDPLLSEQDLRAALVDRSGPVAGRRSTAPDAAASTPPRPTGKCSA
ncbi:MAG TPA: hypothetical protein VHU88_05160 [Sporichthyaceae bacterium]|nr:hypothetical protein [Sporichthyaceae bacterium]